MLTANFTVIMRLYYQARCLSYQFPWQNHNHVAIVNFRLDHYVLNYRIFRANQVATDRQFATNATIAMTVVTNVNTAAPNLFIIHFSFLTTVALNSQTNSKEAFASALYLLSENG